MTACLRHRSRIAVLAVAFALAGATAAPAAVLLSLDEAERTLLPPHETVRKDVMRPTAAEAGWLERQLGEPPARDAYVWRVAERDGQPVGYMLVDNEIGKHEPITFAVALDAEGKVYNVAVCVYRETRGDEVKRNSFMQQFVGRVFGEPIRLGHEITHVSGATISSRSTVAVVNRALALWQLEYGGGADGTTAAAR